MMIGFLPSTSTFLLALAASGAVSALPGKSCHPKPPAPQHEPTVRVKNGTYAGVHSKEYNQDFFLGVPFAQPPVGNLRLRQARPLEKTWEGKKDAKKYAPSCVGYGSDQWGYEISEDCLYLNVIRPAGVKKDQKLPVGLWIHGGGFYQGGGADKRYNMSFIVENSVKIDKPFIGITINYRLAQWGYLASEQIVKEGVTNLGMRDQRLAMQWVKENIAAFGGDPTQVTIFGESAGAMSVGAHLIAYNGRDDGLFRGAILQSGNIVGSSPLNVTQAEIGFQNVTSRVGCSNAQDKLQCLREVPYETLNTVFNTSMSITVARPFIDGDIISGYGSEQLAKGQFVKVPIISGANSDEGASFSPRGINTTADFQRTLSNLPQSFQEAVLKAYPDDLSVNVIATLGNQRPPAYPFGLQYRRSASYYGDQTFLAGRRQQCEVWAKNNLAAYCYRFNAVPNGVPYYLGVPHFQEVAFVFDNTLGEGYGIYPSVSVKPFENRGKAYTDLAYLMSGTWASFIYDLDPNGWKGRQADVQPWPRYSLQDPRDMVFDANVTSYAEKDTYRFEGMKLINDNARAVFNR